MKLTENQKFFLECKPSELLAIALKDLIKCERSPKFRIDMAEWVSQDEEEGVCEVCLAGAALVKTLNVTHFVNVQNKNGFTAKQAQKIADRSYMLNDFRKGYIKDGLSRIGINIDHDTRYNNIPYYYCADLYSYNFDPALFKQSMRNIIKLLKENDL
jgi:hypothetical protein